MSAFSWCEEEEEDADQKPNITEVTFRMSIQQALQSTFGISGMSIVVDVLSWDQSSNTGYIRVAQSFE
ncbi:hypothetical protein VTP01DRAFT_10192 [Rhizomucor pusillus]|uniref:uncharacterized protein n=1 Tax=Rhizomucor pusillus TaxID=4840 RepID=UPI0037433662